MHLKKVWNVIGRILIVILITVLAVLLQIVIVLGVLAYGPSAEWQRRFVATFDETSAMKFVPRIYFPEEQVQSILHPAPTPATEPVDAFVEFGFEDEIQSVGTPSQVIVADPPDEGEQWLELIDIKGPTYKGKMLIIHDPSRVIVGTLRAYGPGYSGKYLYQFIDECGAIAGTNAGGFEDPGGGGNGGTPEGLVIRDGAIAWGKPEDTYSNVIGFDANHILHVGDMSGQEALDLGLTSAVSFLPGPVLVKDGELQTDLGGGMNPRTCIGQTADGTILLMVLEGRKPDSIGATYDDLAQVMFDHGAVNAANLDGGSSSNMYYNGEWVIRGSSLVGMRPLPTAILILNGENNDE